VISAQRVHTLDARTETEMSMTTQPKTGTVAFTITWEAHPGQAEAAVDLMRRMAQAVRSEPGLLLFQIHRSPANDHQFMIYELFTDDAAFAAHQETPHFKDLIVNQALPKLAKRERVAFTPIAA
jgi:quinol monooxygenase YgiN